ncbi:MAG: S53 family peptidase [Chloroflexi bacterium]|nr:S53 family peptidase [Chloroflexota bacterium]
MLLRLLLTLLAGSALTISPIGRSGSGIQPPLFSSFATMHQAGSAYSPDQIETAYDMGPLLDQGLDGSGQTIALMEPWGYNPADIAQFDARFQLPAPTVQQFYAGGTPFTLEKGAETTLDLEWAHALAPGATIQIYYVKNKVSARAGWANLAAGLRQAAASGATTVSMSFGSCRPDTGYKTAERALASLLQGGVSVFVSSGDSGARPGPRKVCGSRIGVAYPASDPSVVAVGGTSLQLNPDNTISQETAWHSSGGGQGVPLLRPLWQVAAQLPQDRYRWAPDVAFEGNLKTGVRMFYKGDWYVAGGTSLGAPAWAAIWALVRQDAQQAGQAVGGAAPLLYRIGNSPEFTHAFHDITRGGNGRYRAGVGWDPVTGWGTPDVNGLAQAILSLSGS